MAGRQNGRARFERRGREEGPGGVSAIARRRLEAGRRRRSCLSKARGTHAAQGQAASLVADAGARAAATRRRAASAVVFGSGIAGGEQAIAVEDRVRAGHEAEHLRFAESARCGRRIVAPRTAGMRMRAVAIMRTSSSGSTGRGLPAACPRPAPARLRGRSRDARGGSPASASIAQRSSTDSPMPMMPPQQTPMPASRTWRERRRRSS